MSLLQQALALAEMGFYVFPCHENTKVPVIKDYSNRATRDSKTITTWWTDPVLGYERDFNIGIACSRYGRGDESLIVVDIDPKNGGRDTELLLELEGKEFGDTLSQKTPSGGQHFIYATRQRLRQGTHTLGPGIDSRSTGGYILGPGSKVGGKPYLFTNRCELRPPPAWVVEALKFAPEIKTVDIDAEINEEYAEERAKFYLYHEAPEAIEGQGGNSTTYKVVARLKDLGVNEVVAKTLMGEIYNASKAIPPWFPDELHRIVDNVYQYGKHDVGISAPEKQFEPVVEKKEEEKLSPIQEMNRKHAYIIIKGKYAIVYETKDVSGRDTVEFWDEAAFHSYYLSKKMLLTVGEDQKEVQITKEWMKHPKRRTYSGIVFKPEVRVGPEWYNLWKGFSFTPSPKGTGEDHASVQAFLKHAKENVCGGDSQLFRWLIGHFAHLIQKPYEKPITALVFKGKKGTGKSTLTDAIGALVGNYYRTVSHPRYLSGNFNSHLENCLVLNLEEAFWSGDKGANGVLKHMVTGKTHQIERKGLESYEVENLTRVYIVGNEEWLVPTSEDERRYAVFNVAETQRGDWRFFKQMRIGFEEGGYSHLLRYLLDYDLSEFNFEEAPNTQGLYDQKVASLDPFAQWWFESISEGEISHLGQEGWPEQATRRELHEAYIYFCGKQRNKRSHFDTLLSFAHRLRQEFVEVEVFRRQTDKIRHRFIQIPPLQEARDRWNRKMGFKHKWDED